MLSNRYSSRKELAIERKRLLFDGQTRRRGSPLAQDLLFCRVWMGTDAPDFLWQGFHVRREAVRVKGSRNG